MQTLAIPITIGRNRLRSHRTGALVDESQGSHLQTMRAILTNEAHRQKGLADHSDPPDPESLRTSLSRMASQSQRYRGLHL